MPRQTAHLAGREARKGERAWKAFLRFGAKAGEPVGVVKEVANGTANETDGVLEDEEEVSALHAEELEVTEGVALS